MFYLFILYENCTSWVNLKRIMWITPFPSSTTSTPCCWLVGCSDWFNGHVLLLILLLLQISYYCSLVPIIFSVYLFMFTHSHKIPKMGTCQVGRAITQSGGASITSQLWVESFGYGSSFGERGCCLHSYCKIAKARHTERGSCCEGLNSLGQLCGAMWRPWTWPSLNIWNTESVWINARSTHWLPPLLYDWRETPHVYHTQIPSFGICSLSSHPPISRAILIWIAGLLDWFHIDPSSSSEVRGGFVHASSLPCILLYLPHQHRNAKSKNALCHLDHGFLGCTWCIKLGVLKNNNN